MAKLMKDEVYITPKEECIDITDEKFISEYIIPSLTCLKEGIGGNEIKYLAITVGHNCKKINHG